MNMPFGLNEVHKYHGHDILFHEPSTAVYQMLGLEVTAFFFFYIRNLDHPFKAYLGAGINW